MRLERFILISGLSVTWTEPAEARYSLVTESGSRDGIVIQIVGPEETVWFNDGQHPTGGNGNECIWNDTPDQSAIAIRDHLGRIHIFGGGLDDTFQMTGTNFSVNPEVPGSLSRNCHPIFSAGFNEPGGWVYENFRNHDWVSAVIVDEEVGNNVYGLIHAEYWGAQSPTWGEYCNANCPSPTGGNETCWVNAITGARSTNGGDQFLRGGFQAVSEDPDVVAKIMDNYWACEGRAGYLGPTNIVQIRDPNTEGARFRAMIEADSTTTKELSQQADGMCVIECGFMYYDQSIVPNGIWRAWGGQAFDRNLGNGDVASVVGGSKLQGLKIKALFYLDDLRIFVGVGSQTDVGGTGNSSIYYALSKDLIHWGGKQKLLDSGSLPLTKGATLYPSLINHGAKTHNLCHGSTTSTEIHLYLVRRLSNAAQSQLHRALSRMRLAVSAF